MGEVYTKDTRVFREWDRDDSSSGDERVRKTTIRRYKVAPSRTERTDRSEFDEERSRVSHYGRTSGDLIEQDRRSYAPDRPRSAFESHAAASHVSHYEDRGRDQAPRSYVYEKETERETYPPPPMPVPPPAPVSAAPAPAPVAVAERPRETLFETKDDWERRSRFDPHFDDDVRVEKRIERYDDGNYRIEKRVEEHIDDSHGCDVERYRKETEYYTPYDPPPPPAPVIIRQRAPEPQKIIVQEAPPPAPVIVSPPPRQDPGVVVIREKEPQRQIIRREIQPPARPQEEEYYYRHERRDTGHRERDYAIERYDRRRREHDHYSDDDDYYVRRTVVRRRERSESPHHKRYLAEGALAGAGVTAFLNSRRDSYGELPEHRGRKVIAGAALGALGTEALRRARSAYEDRWHDDDESPDRHSRIKQGLGLAAVALAAAGAAKYYQSNKIEKEEAARGRSRRRGYYSGDDYSRSRSRSIIRKTTTTTKKSTSRGSRRRSLSTAAKAALGTVAAAGMAKHLRNRSKSRGRSSSRSSSSSRSRSGSRSRSKSRLRRGAEIAGAAVAAKAAHSMWKHHKDKKDDDSSSDDEYYRRRPSKSRSRSRSRSMARSIHSERGTDPELGPVVEYGTDPLATRPDRPASRGYESEAEARRRRRRRRNRSRSASSSASDRGKKRSKSRLGEMAAAGAAAIGIKEYKEKKEREKREQRSRERRLELEREREREQSRDRRDRAARSPSQSRSRSRSRRSRDEEAFDQRTRSPPMASGGAGYPPYPTDPSPPPGGAPFTRFPNPSSDYQSYVPQDYTGYPPPPPGPPRGLSTGPPAAYNPPPPPPGPPGPPPPPGPPRAGGPMPPDNVSDPIHSLGLRGLDEGASRTVKEMSVQGRTETDSSTDVDSEDESHVAKSVTFIPLSPKSSMTMKRHKAEAAAKEEKEKLEQLAFDQLHALVPFKQRSRTRTRHRRSSSSSSSSSDNSDTGRKRRPRGDDTSSDDAIEVLPDRFDRRGEPLDGRSRSRGWKSRKGDFEYRPKNRGDLNVKGAWQVAGTDGEAVERIVRGVTGVLEGKGSWLGILGEVLGGLQGMDQSKAIEDGRHDDGRRRRRRHRD